MYRGFLLSGSHCLIADFSPKCGKLQEDMWAPMLDHAEVDSLALLISHIDRHVSQLRRYPIQLLFLNAGWGIIMLKLNHASTSQSIKRACRFTCSNTTRCSNTAAQADATLESRTSLSLTLERYVCPLHQTRPFNCHCLLEILSMFRLAICGSIKVINGSRFVAAIE